MFCCGGDVGEAAEAIVTTLLEYKANVNITDDHNRTALSTAVEHYPDIAKLLLQPQYTELHTVEALSWCDSTARGPLHYAISLDEEDISKTLTECGADINATADTVNLNMRGFLLGGKSIDFLEVPGMNALMYSAIEHNDDHDKVKRLLQAGMSSNVCTANKYTALMFAAARDGIETTKLLLEHHADANAAEYQGLTALMLAAGAGSTDCCEILLENGANIQARDKEDRSAEDWAIKNGKLDTIQMLRFHAHQRSCISMYHCHRAEGSTMAEASSECCRQTLEGSRCCDHAAGTIGSGPSQPSASDRQERRKPRIPSRACESCEVCTTM